MYSEHNVSAVGQMYCKEFDILIGQNSTPLKHESVL